MRVRKRMRDCERTSERESKKERNPQQDKTKEILELTGQISKKRDTNWKIEDKFSETEFEQQKRIDNVRD